LLEPELHAQGRFVVTRGASLFARIVASAMGMPRAGRDVATSLFVRAEGDELVWLRDFDGTRLESRMVALGDGLIAERRGPIELVLRVAVVDAGIEYRSDGARLRFGRVCIPLPSWLAVRVTGRVWAKDDVMHTRIHIASWMGTIVTYEGPLNLPS
jgi:hypothetical protein